MTVSVFIMFFMIGEVSSFSFCSNLAEASSGTKIIRFILSVNFLGQLKQVVTSS